MLTQASAPVAQRAVQSDPVKPDASSPNPVVGQVTVALVVDQFPAWLAQDRLPLLPETGGFARLRKEGTWYRDMRYAHAITETAPGHSSLYTGQTPREHGIVANELLVDGRATAILVDKNSHLVGVEGERPEIGSSGAALTAASVADRFKAQIPSGKVYAFSLKDRGAIVGGGQHPDLTLWYDAGLGQFVSSTAFTRQLPSWVLPAIGQKRLQALLAQPWSMLDGAWVAAHSVSKDDEAGEGNLANYGTVFAHSANASTKPFAAIRVNPKTDRLLLELGLLALDNSPGDQPVFLAISLSANDYIGHVFGPDSWEAWDELRRLDATLGWFFSELDSRKGATHWSAALTGDHGVAPLPEVSRALAKQHTQVENSSARPDQMTERLAASTLEKIARDAAVKAVGKGEWIAGLVDPYLYLTSNAKGLPEKQLTKLRFSVTAALSATRGIGRLFDVSTLAVVCPPNSDESTDALVCRSVQSGRGGDYFVELSPGYFFDTSYVPGFGTSHGSVALYDRSVPLLVRAPGQVDTGKVVDVPQSFEAFSRELAKRLNLK